MGSFPRTQFEIENDLKNSLFTWIKEPCMTFSLFSCIFAFIVNIPFFLQADLIKEGKTANSNGVVPAAQSSPPEDDDEAQTDDPSQDGAPGGNSALQVLFAKFLI
jgi:hypothetical protein